MMRVQLTLAVTLLLLAAGCTDPQPSVLLITVDSLRADTAVAQVDGKPIAPRLAALTKDSLVYESVTSPAPWTTPSCMSLMTGLPAFAHGVETHDRALASSVETLAERFKAAGYRTGAVVPAVTLREAYGFDRGFERFVFESYGHRRISSPGLSGQVRNLIDRWKGEPFFIWVHYWDPHYDYNPPAPFDQSFPAGAEPHSTEVQCLKWWPAPVDENGAAYLRAQFRGEVRYWDDYLGELLDAADALDQEVVVAVSADHGEAFLEHGWLGHTNRVDEVLVHVPLVLHAPGRVAPGQVSRPVSLTGLGATLLDVSGVGSEGFGAVPPLPLHGAETVDTPPVMTRTLRRGCYTAWREESLKYVLDHRSCSESLFDLDADPGEMADLAALRPEDTVRLRQSLAARLDALTALGVPRAMLPREGQEEAEALLRSLGYVAGGGGAAGGGQAPLPQSCRPASAVQTGQDTRDVPRDSFGDLAPPPCPPDGALECLSRLAAANPSSR